MTLFCFHVRSYCYWKLNYVFLFSYLFSVPLNPNSIFVAPSSIVRILVPSHTDICIYLFYPTIHTEHLLTTTNLPSAVLISLQFFLSLDSVLLKVFGQDSMFKSSINSFSLWLYYLLDIQLHSFVDNFNSSLRVAFHSFLLNTVSEYGKHLNST